MTYPFLETKKPLKDKYPWLNLSPEKESLFKKYVKDFYPADTFMGKGKDTGASDKVTPSKPLEKPVGFLPEFEGFTEPKTTRTSELENMRKAFGAIGVPFTMFGAALTDLIRGNINPTAPNLLRAINDYMPGGEKEKEYKEWEAPGFRIPPTKMSDVTSDVVTPLDPMIAPPEKEIEVPSLFTLLQDEQGKISVKILAENLPFFIGAAPELSQLAKTGAIKGATKSYEATLGKKLNRWIAIQGRLDPGIQSTLGRFIVGKHNRLIEYASNNLKKRLSESITKKTGYQSAVKVAAQDTVNDIEKNLLPEFTATRTEATIAKMKLGEIQRTPSVEAVQAGKMELTPTNLSGMTSKQYQDWIKTQNVDLPFANFLRSIGGILDNTKLAKTVEGELLINQVGQNNIIKKSVQAYDSNVIDKAELNLIVDEFYENPEGLNIDEIIGYHRGTLKPSSYPQPDKALTGAEIDQILTDMSSRKIEVSAVKPAATVEEITAIPKEGKIIPKVEPTAVMKTVSPNTITSKQIWEAPKNKREQLLKDINEHVVKLRLYEQITEPEYRDFVVAFVDVRAKLGRATKLQETGLDDFLTTLKSYDKRLEKPIRPKVEVVDKREVPTSKVEPTTQPIVPETTQDVVPVTEVVTEKAGQVPPVVPETAAAPPSKPPIPPVTGKDWESAIPPSNPPSGRPRTLSDLNREAKGMRAMTPEQRAEAMDVARPIPEGELLYKVKPFEEHARNLLMPDSPIMARLRSLPGVKQIVGAWTPAQMARDNPVHMIGIRKSIFEEIETGRARTASLAWWNDAQEILGFQERYPKGKLPLKGVWKATGVKPTAKADTQKANYRTIDDILENPKHYNLTAEQKKVLRIGQNMQRQLLRDAQRVGVNAVELGEAYWHRIVLKGPKDKMQGHWIRGRLSGRKGYTHQRAFEKVDQGTELGFVYETHPLTRLQARLEAGIRTISDQEARKAISRLPGVEKPLERLESRYPQTLEGQKVAKEARNIAKQTYLKNKTIENYTVLRQAEADYIVSMREVYKRKIEVGNPSYYELRLPNGKIAPGELVEEVKKYIELPEIAGDETAKTVVEITRLVRTTLTNVDLAAGFIQGQVLFYRHNPSWWKAQAHALVSLIDDPYAYVAKNQELMDEGMRVGAISIPTEFMFSKRGIASIPTRVPGIGRVMRACNRAFEWFIVVGQTELYRTTRTGVLKGVAKKEARKATVVSVKPEPIAKVGEQTDQEGVDALVSLGSAIRKELGTESYAILGVAARQRTVEQLIAFAARFFRANVGIIGQSFTKGVGGAEARKGMGSLIAGGASLLIGANFLMYGKMPNLDDPFAPDWMMVRIGKTYFSPFGPFYSYFRAIARAGVRTVEGKPLDAANEIKRFLQGRAGIPYRALDIAGQLLWANEATTFEGEVIEKTPLGIAGGVLGELAVPISVQEATQAIPEGRPEAAIAEIFGLVGRGSPYAQMDMMFQDETDINPEGKSFRYAEPWQEKEMAKRFPDIAEMMAGRGHGKYGHAQRQWNDIDEKYYAQEEALAREFKEAEAGGFEEGISHSEFGDRYKEIQAARVNEKAGVNSTLKLFQDERDLPDDPNDRALAEYHQLFDKTRTASGRINWDESDELMAKLEATWTPEQLEFVERNTGLRNHPPLIEEYRKARKTVSESGYWKIEEPDQYQKRQALRRQNPEIEAILVKWYGYKPILPPSQGKLAEKFLGRKSVGSTQSSGNGKLAEKFLQRKNK